MLFFWGEGGEGERGVWGCVHIPRCDKHRRPTWHAPKQMTDHQLSTDYWNRQVHTCELAHTPTPGVCICSIPAETHAVDPGDVSRNTPRMGWVLELLQFLWAHLKSRFDAYVWS